MATARVSLIEENLECSICLETLKRPRTLPCQHTFCEDCLSTFVISIKVRSNGFPCPTCRTYTTISCFDSKVINDRASWVKMFPINETVNRKLEKKLQKGTPLTNCQSCVEHGKGPRQADIWCKNCCVLLCKDCEAVHDFLIKGHSKVTSNQYEDAKYLLSENDVKCSKHGVCMEFFCCDHRQLVCSHCLKDIHKKCEEVLNTSTYRRTQMTSEGVYSKWDALSEMENTLYELQVKSSFEISDLEHQKSGLQWEIVERRKRINFLLDEHDRKSVKRLDDYVRDIQNVTKESSSRLSRLQQRIKEFRRQTNLILAVGSDAQVIATLGRLQREIKYFDEEKQEIVKNLQQKEVKINYPSCIEEFLKNGLQDIEISAQESTMPEKNNCFIYRMESKVRLPDDESLCCVSGIQVLNNELVFLCDKFNGKLKYFHLNNPKDVKLGPILGDVFDVCQLDDNSVIVSHPAERKLSIVSVVKDAMKVSKTLKVGGACYGLDQVDGKVFVVCSDGPQSVVKKIDIKTGEVLSTLTSRLFTQQILYLCVSREKQIAISLGTNVILLLNEQGKLVRQVKSTSDQTIGFGMAADTDGSLLLCSCDEDKVEKLAGYRFASQQTLLGKTEGICKPLAITLSGKIAIITQRNSDSVQLFWFK